MFTHLLKFLLTLGICFRIGHFKAFKRIHDGLRNDQVCVFLIIGRDNIPGSCRLTGGIQASLIGLHIFFPIFPLLYIVRAYFPILCWIIYAFKKSTTLFFFGKMQKKFNDPCPIIIKMFFQVPDGTITLLPNGLWIQEVPRHLFCLKDLRMYPCYQHFLIIRTVEYADLSTLRKVPGCAP